MNLAPGARASSQQNTVATAYMLDASHLRLKEIDLNYLYVYFSSVLAVQFEN